MHAAGLRYSSLSYTPVCALLPNNLPLRLCLCADRRGHLVFRQNDEAESGGGSGEGSELTVSLSLLVVGEPVFDVLGAIFEHGVDMARQAMGSRCDGDRFALVQLATIEGRRRRVAAVERADRHTKRSCSTVFVLAGARGEFFAARDAGVGRKAEPGREVADRWPATHVRADLAEHGQGGQEADAEHLGQVGPRLLIQQGAGIEPQGFLGLATLLGGRRQRCLGFEVGSVVHRHERLLDLLVHLADLACEMLPRRQGLAQRKEMLLPPRPAQGLGDLLLGSPTPGVAQRREHARIAFAGEEALEDRHAGQSSDVTNDQVQLEIHLDEGLLHALGRRRLRPHQLASLTNVAAQDDRLVLGPEGSLKQPARVELLDPLAVEHVALAPRDVLHMRRVHEADVEAGGLEYLENRYPQDAGGFHRDGSDPLALEPLDHLVQTVGEGTELPYGFPSTFGRHRHPMAVATDVDSGGVFVDHREMLRCGPRWTQLSLMAPSPRRTLLRMGPRFVGHRSTSNGSTHGRIRNGAIFQTTSTEPTHVAPAVINDRSEKFDSHTRARARKAPRSVRP